VIDASLAIRAVLPATAEAEKDLGVMASWQQAGVSILAPEIWLPEAVSAIRQAVIGHMITEKEGQNAVADIFDLGVEIVLSDAHLCQNALAWAARLGHSKAYDSFYLALAEKTEAELWTADQRLVNRAHQVNVAWVRWIGERE
jgi:predicted nucleic acid-binding protein